MPVRWVFPDPSEDEARRHIEARIDDWWSALAARWTELETALRANRPLEVERIVEPGLRAITDGVVFELRRTSLVLSCEAERSLQPLVDTIARRAPKNLPFPIATARDAEPAHSAVHAVEGRFDLEVASWAPEVQLGPHGLLSVEWTGGSLHDGAAALLTQGLLGERLMGDWVGEVTMKPKGMLGRVFSRARPEALPDRVETLRRAVLAKTADRPLLTFSSQPKDAAWSLLSIDSRLDRSSCHQPDLERARTANVDFFAASRSGAPFSSCRFSRFGERFAYLQLEGFADDGLRNTLQLEEALDRALGTNGRVIGGGTGTRFSYVDLVFADPHLAVPIVLDVLRQGRLPRGTWLRFFDDVWAGEWVGVWPETPPP